MRRRDRRSVGIVMGILKAFGIILLVLFVVALAVVFHFRYEIFQASAERIIKDNLPDYVHVDRIIFDLENEVMRVKGFGIKNPKGFQYKYLVSIGSVTCRYKMRGKNITDGIEVTSITAARPEIYLERGRGGRININEMGRVVEDDRLETEMKKKMEKEEGVEKPPRFDIKSKLPDIDISDLVKLTNLITFSGGRLVVLDKAVSRTPYQVSLENAEGKINLDLNRDYTKALRVATEGSGYVNGDPSQLVTWVVSWQPQTAGLTMSNRVVINDADLLLFKPYYDWYSPVDIRGGTFSGTLVFDFHEDRIGSDNVIVFKGLKFVEKKQDRSFGLWNTSVTDIIQYLRNSSGDVVFDFKVKGTIQAPEFFVGPRVKDAVQRMAFDQVGRLLAPPQQGDAQAGAPKSQSELMLEALQGLLKNQ